MRRPVRRHRPPLRRPPQPALHSAGPASSGSPPSELCRFIKLDGREVQAKKLVPTLFEVCLHGVDAATSATIRGSSSPAVCQQCLVEVVGQPKLVPACLIDRPTKWKRTPRPARAHHPSANLEFTLVNHPVTVRSRQGGRVHAKAVPGLQDHHGSRRRYPRSTNEDAGSGSHIVLDAERCIPKIAASACGDEVAGENS